MGKEAMPLKMNLQFFAEPESGSQEAAADTSTSDQEAKQADVAADSKQEQKKEEGVSDTGKSDDGAKVNKDDIAALLAEELKKASMTPEEKEKYEASEREKKLADRESAISLRELQADAKDLLADNGLPAEFRDMVIGKDREETEKNVKTMKASFDAAVQAQVETRLKGKTPSAGTGVTGGSENDTLMATVESYL